MTPYLTIPTATPEFEAFLFASIGEERNGMALSVLSGLSRLGVDPWDDAARLSLLPKARAIDALNQRIARLPLGSWQLSDTAAIAARLVELLPKHISPMQTIQAATVSDGKKKFLASLPLWLLAAGLAVSLLFVIPAWGEHLAASDTVIGSLPTSSTATLR